MVHLQDANYFKFTSIQMFNILFQLQLPITMLLIHSNTNCHVHDIDCTKTIKGPYKRGRTLYSRRLDQASDSCHSCNVGILTPIFFMSKILAVSFKQKSRLLMNANFLSQSKFNTWYYKDYKTSNLQSKQNGKTLQRFSLTHVVFKEGVQKVEW